MGHIREIYHEFEERGARAVTIMAESQARIHDFLEDHHYPFPILSDARRTATKAYGVYVRVNFESVNISRPAEFVLDAEGIIRYFYIARIQTDFAPDKEIFAVLDNLKT